MRFPVYPEYKESGFDWLGKVPSHWDIRPLWTAFRRLKRTGFIEEELLSVYRDHGVVPKSSRDDNNNNASEDLDPYQLVEIGDLVINKMKAWQGSVAISKFRGIVSPAYFVYQATHKENSTYLHFLMRSLRYITAYLSISKGIRVGQWDLEPQYHSRIPLLIPPINEQLQIVNFLNYETTKIDLLIAEQEKLVELLREKRQAVISHAVTKGLDPNVSLKDSDVEWLGEVPTHWDVRKLKFLADIQTGDKDTENAKEEGEYPFFVRSQNIEKIGSFTFNCEAILTAGDGAGVGKVFHYFNGAFDFHQRVYMLNNFKDVIGKYLFHYFKENFYKVALEGGAKSTVDSLRRPMLLNFSVCIPSLPEQEKIVQFVEIKATEFDQLVEEALKTIELLRERRSALISAVVTGQIDVRNASTELEFA